MLRKNIKKILKTVIMFFKTKIVIIKNNKIFTNLKCADLKFFK